MHKTLSLNLNTNNIFQDINIMTSSPSTCGICDVRHISKPSDVWCPECDQGFCIDCKGYHCLFSASRNHSTIPISEYQKLPSFVLEIREFCKGYNYTVKSMDVPVAKFVSWKIIANAKV
jgi:hypothetical protein